MNHSPAITIQNLSFGFPGREVLAGIDLDIPAGTVLGVLGRSGSGKSTLLNLLLGLLEQGAGQILLDGQALDAAGRRGRGGYVPQKPSLLPWRTVLDNLTLPAELERQPAAQARGRALALLSRFGLQEAAQLWPHQLSGGMAQRVAVLRAVMFAPKLLLLDEPFSALDALTRLEFQNWLAELQHKNHPTTVLVTHDVREALLLCHQVVVLAGSPARVALSVSNTPSLGNGVPPNPLLEQTLLDALLPALLWGKKA